MTSSLRSHSPKKSEINPNDFTMNLLDLFLIIPLIWAGIRGFSNGLVKEVFSLLALTLGIFLSYKLSYLAARHIHAEGAELIAFAICFIAVVILTIMVGRGVGKVVKIAVPDFVNKICGVVFGVVKVLFICSIALYFLKSIDTKEVILKSKTTQKSLLYPYVEKSTLFLSSHKDDAVSTGKKINDTTDKFKEDLEKKDSRK